MAVAAMQVAAQGSAIIRFTVSIGVALPTSDLPSDLLSRADAALYTAKKAGRNRVIQAA